MIYHVNLTCLTRYQLPGSGVVLDCIDSCLCTLTYFVNVNVLWLFLGCRGLVCSVCVLFPHHTCIHLLLKAMAVKQSILLQYLELLHLFNKCA